jgi:predicted nucleic acid-binding protein
MILVDSNVLLRRAKPSDPLYPTAITAVNKLTTAGESLFIVPQSLFEFWVVATRPPANNGLGLSVHECHRELTRVRHTFPLLFDKNSILDEWERIVLAHQCTGKPAHDARLVAAMRVHFVPSILTFNVADFQRYPGITVIDPATV